jgi:hypothetical protein
MKSYLKDSAKGRDRFIYGLVFALGTLQKALLKLVREPLWRSQDGRVRTARNIKSKHLKNIIRLLEREGETDDPFYPFACAELERRRNEVPRSSLRTSD